MVDQVLDIVITPFMYVTEWFGQVMMNADAGGFYLGAIFAMVSYKFLLAPVFGRIGSDTVRKKTKGDNNE